MSETDIVAAVIGALQATGHWAWRCNSGAIMLEGKHGKRLFRGAPTGTPDVFCVLPGGRLIGLEVKTPKGRQSPGQKAWQERAERTGVPYAVVRSAGEALRFVRSIRKGPDEIRSETV